MNKQVILLLKLMVLVFSSGSLPAWGWDAHRYINEYAIDCLPAEMQFFNDQRDYLRAHSVDPDQSDLPGYYHYIDIDYYAEFFDGTLPHDFDDLVNLYDYNTVIGNGTVPWVIVQWTDSLTNLMASGDWDSAWQIAAELGHFVADSHQPLHLTLNYNGQNTGNYGIHSRYESVMINPYLPALTPVDTTAAPWTDIIDSVFNYIGHVYPYVDLIMAADDYASGQDPDYGPEYYDLMWAQLDSITIDALDLAVVNLASVWYTAWLAAGSPVLDVAENSDMPTEFVLDQNYPNPFNPQTSIRYYLPHRTNVSISIYNTLGVKVADLVSEVQLSGCHTVTWDGSEAASGVYFYRLATGDFVVTRKMLLIK